VKDALWVLGILFLTFPGTIVWRVPAVRRLDLAGRLAIAFATGVVIASTLLYLYSLAHVPWTRTTTGIPLLVLGLIGVLSVGGVAPAGTVRPRAGLHTWTPIAIFLLLTLYSVLTARETTADLIFFWGPKAQRFHDAGKIDFDFLAFPHYYLMHPDYPPLLPLTYAWASLVAHRFSWWGPLVMLPIALAAIAAAFRGLSRPAIGDERSGWYALLMTAILAYGSAIGMIAGGGDPMLLLFEVIALAALTFGGDDRGLHTLAAIALAGAAFTKVEGAAFVAITVVAYAITTRRFVRSIAIAVPAAILLGSWLLLSWRYNLLDSYSLAKGKIHLDALGSTLQEVLRQSSYGAAWLPWLAALAPLLIRRRWKGAFFPLLVAGGTIAVTLFFYLHHQDPSWWIKASAQRVLLTPLACVVVASAAASE
jgi:hypothetical protein